VANVVGAGFADRCELQVVGAINKLSRSASAATFGTGKVAEDKLTAAIREVFDLRPAAIIRDLKTPNFRAHRSLWPLRSVGVPVERLKRRTKNAQRHRQLST
jgi:S-adenosylmethionine synthetase